MHRHGIKTSLESLNEIAPLEVGKNRITRFHENPPKNGDFDLSKSL